MRILPTATLLVAALAVAHPAPVLAIQPDVEPDLRAASACCQDQMEAAEALLREGRWREARREYRRVSDRQIEADEFPGHALWQVAEIENAHGSVLRAARHLDRIARHAERFGQPTMQVRALTEAVDLYRQVGRNDLALQRYTRVEALLASPDVGEAARRIATTRFQNRTLARGRV